jgi:hypothetical protein
MRSLMCVAPLAVLLALVVGCGGGNSHALRRVSPPHGGFSIELPSDWRFLDASYPSDHATYYWYDPHDAFAKLRVIGSGCVGCVTKNNDGVTPNPSGEMPQYATVTARSDPYVLSFDDFDTPYSGKGMVVVTHRGSDVTGSLILELWLPEKDAAETTQILASFRSGG